MSARHTPGPWRVGDAGSTVFGAPGSRPLMVASITHRIVPDATQRANARLIAAAPEMLDALRLVLRQGEAIHPDMSTLSYVREAIAKAEGQC